MNSDHLIVCYIGGVYFLILTFFSLTCDLILQQYFILSTQIWAEEMVYILETYTRNMY